MKRILLLAAILLTGTLAAQSPTTTWPYRYPLFADGTLILTNGQEMTQKVNIHLLKGDLHFIDDKGLIQMAPAGQFSSVRIGTDTFRRVEGLLLRVVPGPDERNFVAVRQTVDLTSLNETGGAYGVSSATSSTRRVTSFDMDGTVNVSHKQLEKERENGRKVRIKTEYYLVLDGKLVKADKKDAAAAAGPERAEAFQQFLKNNKINWKNEQSLLTLFLFFKP